MKWRDYVAEREAGDAEFKDAREETRAQFEFQRALISARIQHRLTQREMAERLGVKQAAVARWEAGETMPTLETLFRVAKAFELEFSVSPETPLAVTHRAAVRRRHTAGGRKVACGA